MPFHVRRSYTAKQTPLSTFSARLSHWERSPPGSNLSVIEIQRTDPRGLAHLSPASNPLNPPYHWHWRQDEYFRIRRGRYIFTVEGVETTYTRDDTAAQPIHVPPRQHHTFRLDPSSEDEQGEIEISAAPADDGLSERFFRNLYSYLHDCHTQDVGPSLPQLLLFLDDAEVSLALPGPRWLANPASWALGVVVGRWFGGLMLGYKASYPEYYEEVEESVEKKNE